MAYNMKKGSGTANANTPGSFSSKDTDTLKNLSKSAFDVNAPVDPSFKSDAGEVVITSRKVSSDPVSFEDAGSGIRAPKIRDIKGEVISRAGESIFNNLPFGGIRGKDASKMFKGGRFTTVKIN